jgi:spoIIIJ-associated protein
MTDGMLFTGKTVEDAVAEGLRSLGLTQEQVEVEVISRGSRGLFGIGSEPAQVRLTPRTATRATPSAPASPAAAPLGSERQPPSAPPTPAPVTAPSEVSAAPTGALAAADEVAPAPVAAGEAEAEAAAAPVAAEAPDTFAGAFADDSESAEPSAADDAEMAALAVELLSETVHRMGFEAEVVASWQEPDADNDDRYLLLNLHGRDLGALIGRRGDTLSNLQYLLRLMVNQRLHQWKNIVVDVEQYRQHRAEHLMQLALRSAEQVAKTGRPLSLEPMPPNERRIIHLALRDHANVYTESSGEGERRKIQILPKRS